MVAQQVAEKDEEIVVVDEVLLALIARVLLAQADEVVQVVVELRVAVLHHLGDRLRAVHRHAQDLQDRALARKAAVLLVEAGARAQQVHDVFRVAAVEDREVRLETEAPRGPAEHEVREGVERAARDLLAARADERRRAPEHLLRGLAREREEQDVPGIHPRLDEPGDAVHERPRLPAARAGDDEDGPVERRRGLELRRVQLARVVDPVARRGALLGPPAKRVGFHREGGARMVPRGVQASKEAARVPRPCIDWSAGATYAE
jgi:hypothetical protein